MAENGGFGDSAYSDGDAAPGAEDLDPVESLTGDDPDEITPTGYSPPEREPRSLRAAPTPAEERAGPSLEDRLSQEEPDETGVDEQPER